MAGNERRIDSDAFFGGKLDIVNDEGILAMEEKSGGNEQRPEKPRKVQKSEKSVGSEKNEKGEVDKIENLEDKIREIQSRIEVGGKKNNINKLTQELKDLNTELSLLRAKDARSGNSGKKSEFWVESRSDWQKEIVGKSREAVIAAKKLRDQESKTNIVPEVNPGAEAAIIPEAAPVVASEKVILAEGNEAEIKTLEGKKAKAEEYLKTLNAAFEESKKRDPNFSKGADRDVALDDLSEAKTRAKIGISMTKTREEISEIEAKIGRLSNKSDINAEIKKDVAVQKDERSSGRKKLVMARGEGAELAPDEKDATVEELNEERARQRGLTKETSEQKSIGPDSIASRTDIVKDSGDWDRLIAENNEKRRAKKNALAASSSNLIKKDNLSKTNSLTSKTMEKNKEGAVEGVDQEPTKDVAGVETIVDKPKNNKGKNKAETWYDERSKMHKEQAEAKRTKAALKPGSKNEPVEQPTDEEKQLKEKIDKVKNLPEDTKEIIRESLMDQEVGRIETDASLENREQVIKEKEGQIEAQAKKLAEVKEAVERAKEVEVILKNMQDELDKQFEQVKNPSLKEKAKRFFKDPKVRGAIIVGLAGAGVYAASGGTAVPVYFAAKAALAKAGISIFVPAAAGHGLSTWGTAAAAGGFSGYLAEKLGLVKGEKSEKEKKEENIERLRNIAGGEEKREPGTEPKIEELLDAKGNFDIGVITKLVKEKDQGLIKSYENDPVLLDNMVKALSKKSSIFQFSDKQKNINETYLWLVKEQKRVEMKNKIAQEIAEQKAEEAAGKPESVSAPKKEVIKEAAEIFKFDKSSVDMLTQKDKEQLREIAKKYNLDFVGEAPTEVDETREISKLYESSTVDKMSEEDKIMIRDIAQKHGIDIVGEKPAKKEAAEIFKFTKSSAGELDQEDKDKIRKIAVDNNLDFVGEPPTEVDETRGVHKFDKPEAPAGDNKQLRETALENEVDIVGEESETKKRAESQKGSSEIAKMISENSRKMDTSVIFALHEAVDKQIDTHHYDIAIPVIKFAKHLVENREKFAFLKKADKTEKLTKEKKEALIREIKSNVLRLASEKQLGATSEEAEKNKQAIEVLLDSEEFKDNI